MTEQQKIHLSALADDELEPSLCEATVSVLQSNRELRATWERYHMIGCLVRGEAVQLEYRDIATGVQSRLVEEPVPLPATGQRPDHPSRATPYLGIGLAAGAAFFAVFAVPKLFDINQGTDLRESAIASASLPQRFRLNESGQRWQLDRPDLEHKLDRFLVNHQATSSASGLKGFIPLATVVGYDMGR